MQPPVRIEVDRAILKILHCQNESDLRIATQQWFGDLKALIRLDPEFGVVTDQKGRAIAELQSVPEDWVDWFRNDRLVLNFSTPEASGEAKTGFKEPYRNIALSYGTPGDMPSRLAITASPILTSDTEWLLSRLSNAIEVWGGEEARIARKRPEPWLHWLKDDKEPEGFARTPMPGGWSERRPLQNGMLYIWPENRPGP